MSFLSLPFSSATVLLGLAILFIAVRRRHRSSSLPLPPGPKGLPIVGNLFDVPTRNMAPALHELCKQHGDVVYLNVLGQPTIVIGSYEAAVALLETRSANTCGRPRLVMTELAGMSWQFSLQGYTAEWRRKRRTFHEVFNRGVVPQYRPIHLRERRKLLQRLLQSPERFLAHAHRFIAGSIMGAAYDIELAEGADEYIAISERNAESFASVVIPGKYLVELFPALATLPAWLPGMGFKRQATEWRRDVDAMKDVPFAKVSNAMTRGTARPSIASALLEAAYQENGNVFAQDENHIKEVLGLAYGAGADTTFASLNAFFLAMTTYPDVQQKAQAELDRVVGQDRLVDFDDRKHLQYVNALVMECSRWHTVIPLGLPHRSLEEDTYNGYRIPAGSIMIANAWAMARDPIAYHEPERFMPERFVEDGKLNQNVRDPRHFQFGFGRRICPGRHFSDEALFIAVASVLQIFSIQPPVNKDGQPVPISVKIPLDGTNSHPEPFVCKIQPRSENTASLIKLSTITEAS